MQKTAENVIYILTLTRLPFYYGKTVVTVFIKSFFFYLSARLIILMITQIQPYHTVLLLTNAQADKKQEIAPQKCERYVLANFKLV